MYKQAQYKIQGSIAGIKINIRKEEASDERKSADNAANKHRLFNGKNKCKKEKCTSKMVYGDFLTDIVPKVVSTEVCSEV